MPKTKKPKKQKPFLGVDSDLPTDSLPGAEGRSITLKDGTNLAYDDTCMLLVNWQRIAHRCGQDPSLIGKDGPDEILTDLDMVAMTLWAATAEAQQAQGVEMKPIDFMKQTRLADFQRVQGEVSEIMELLNPNEEGPTVESLQEEIDSLKEENSALKAEVQKLTSQGQ
jgi:hypothetical protein